MAQSQPVTIPVSCLDESSGSEPVKIESVVAAATSDDEAVDDDHVGSSSVEGNHHVQVETGNATKESVPQVANYTSVVAGKDVVPCKISFDLYTLHFFGRGILTNFHCQGRVDLGFIHGLEKFAQ